MKKVHLYGMLALGGAAIAACLHTFSGRDIQSASSASVEEVRQEKSEDAPGREPPLASFQKSAGSAPASNQPPISTIRVVEIRDLGGEFDRLAKVATEGDIAVARALLEVTQECLRAPEDPSDLEKLRRGLNDPNSGAAKMGLGEAQKERILEDAKRSYERCRHATNAQMDRMPEWALLMAESGDAEAKVNYAMVGKPRDMTAPDVQKANEEFIERAKGYLNDEIARGNADALMMMGLGYNRATFRSSTTPLGSEPYQAYKYYYAFGLTESGRMTDIAAGNLAKLEDKLEPDQINAAREDGTAIYEMCCKH
jgi:hypothetical protein